MGYGEGMLTVQSILACMMAKIFHCREIVISPSSPAMSILCEVNFILTVQEEGASLAVFQLLNGMIFHVALAVESTNTRRHFSQSTLHGKNV